MCDAYATCNRRRNQPAMTEPRLLPGSLWPAIVQRTQHALACGALRPIETVQTTVDDAGVRFVVRQVSSVARKDDDGRQRRAAAAEGARHNPFLPCDPDLVVCDLGARHRVVLNKFNVIAHHLLIVTRRFEAQEALVNESDFEALFTCLAEFDGLGFYNGGALAGASQPHKHLQIVPLPLSQTGPAVPVEPLFADDGAGAPRLPFAHAFARLDARLGSNAPRMAQHACAHYRALMEAAGLRAVEIDGEAHQSAPYNLLVTREWMLLVPRSAASVEGIAVNGLGFAGSLFVRDAAQMRAIAELGPMTVLRRAAGPAPA